MFKPKFKYTDRIVNNLTFIAESNAVILNSPLIPKWEVTLRRDAILNSVHASTGIEGNSLTIEDVTALANGNDVIARDKDKLEVLNYLNALKMIPDFAKIDNFAMDDFLYLHKILTDGTIDYPNASGNLRDRQVYVGSSDGSKVFVPPKTEKVEKLVLDFLKWFNLVDNIHLNPIIVAGLTHYEIVRIHPFIDGNGRIARTMATLALYKQGFDLKRFFALDDYYDIDRPRYYAALRSVDPKTRDLTEWLNYFTDGVAFSMKAVREKVITLSKNVKNLKESGQIALNERQMAIVEKILSDGKITNRDIQKMFSISDTMARKETVKLEKLNVIKREGSGRNTHYILT
ncbi:MAG: Fic family protein [Methanobrevibacter sp.]|nr:Fic family protein [Candidatus Methanoflexus mossambicus]